MITRILPNMTLMRNIKQVSEGDRLFYELGYKIDPYKMSYENNWIGTGKFKEINDVKDFLLNDEFLSDLEYL